MGKPLVSVVITTYNRAEYVCRAIESVLAQTYGARELVVIDDGSTDDTRERLSVYDRELTYVRQENAERGAARNHGLRLARGDFIAFLDSDDEWRPDKLELDARALTETDQAAFAYSDYELIDDQGRSFREVRCPSHNGRVTQHLLRENFVAFGGHAMRTEIFRRCGGFREERELSGSEDWEAWVRLSTQAEFVHIPAPTARIRVHFGNTMAHPEGMDRSMRYACELMRTSGYLGPSGLAHLSAARATVALISAINHCTANARHTALRRLGEALRHRPGIISDPRFGYTIARCVLGPDLMGLRARGHA